MHNVTGLGGEFQISGNRVASRKDTQKRQPQEHDCQGQEFYQKTVDTGHIGMTMDECQMSN
jgi:hypothetical protein